MGTDTTGVATLGRILKLLSQEEGCTATTLARKLGTARATTFEVVRQLDAAGFIDRSASGRITPGPASAALGFAFLGFGSLADAAEALLPVLRDDTDASVDLIVRWGDVEIAVIRRAARGTQGDGSLAATEMIEEPVRTGCGAIDARLRLHLRAGANTSERIAARTCLRSVADALGRPAGERIIERVQKA